LLFCQNKEKKQSLALQEARKIFNNKIASKNAMMSGGREEKWKPSKFAKRSPAKELKTKKEMGGVTPGESAKGRLSGTLPGLIREKNRGLTKNSTIKKRTDCTGKSEKRPGQMGP